MKWIAAIIASLALAGCAGQDIAVQPVNIVSSDFCEIQKDKLTWDVKDTGPTIKGIRRFNAKWDARCGKGKSTS
jgi:outer membrane murein-binding lipoprotein Lpp